jgi:hypothetical protein
MAAARTGTGRPAVFVQQLHRAAAQRGRLDPVFQDLSDHWTRILQRLYPVWALIGPGLSDPGHIEIHSRTVYLDSDALLGPRVAIAAGGLEHRAILRCFGVALHETFHAKHTKRWAIERDIEARRVDICRGGHAVPPGGGCGHAPAGLRIGGGCQADEPDSRRTGARQGGGALIGLTGDDERGIGGAVWAAPLPPPGASRDPTRPNGNMCSMTSQGSALVRFDRAVRTGNPNIVIAAAHELPRPVLLRDALRVLLVLAVADHGRYPPAAARFGARLVAERKLSVAEAQLVFAALQTLPGSDPLAGGEALCVLLEQHGERDGARYLEEWLRTRDS